ncbi:hypothetical protein DPMN_169226 [Dreissena polymorpha]|uniref:Uncharacterized protein n=1 Tax=Dreissena polymorpha TaxID=45954 RepID=A0A9D4IWN0_DREPO|nr:hypothetical protein DPMN_169226 [Dreissena polymorpha]
MNSALDEAKQSMKAFLETLKKETIVDLDTKTLSHSLQTIKTIQATIDEVRFRIQQHSPSNVVSH